MNNGAYVESPREPAVSSERVLDCEDAVAVVVVVGCDGYAGCYAGLLAK